jgi:hypothetical protein
VSFVSFSNEDEWFKVVIVGKNFEVLVDVSGCANSVTFIEFVQEAANVVVLIEFTGGQSALGSLDL